MRIEEPTFAAAQAGDPAALARLLAATRPDIRRYASYQCQRSSSVDDVVQEALIILSRRIGAVRSGAALGGWLSRVVMRLCMLPALMFLRGVEGVKSIEDAARFSRMPVDDLRLDLARALESLPAAHREIILMRDLQEMRIGEIAAALGITQEAAKSRLHRARTMMREYLQ
jgi:RNA polymerase sigma factor (sigma-70 family)